MLKVYEIGVYNSVIREIVRSGAEIPKTNDIHLDYESVIYVERFADSEEHASLIAEREWPKRKGYVHEYIKLVRG
tara:strand:+ start:544 stop:768 length:225 start_codon:yes stop_codon:yes gene_type:complete